ncbi:nitroreductase family protein [Romboutsia lituseburensis]|uniref:nitroreductase family protein n=1 Tax=Romboutsia lituseburensis TaxID=1537 RepID=UPI00215B0454|nr:nitroreductase family protein [Romboutsia lituseburensis]MCR8744905.1 nitroreductase family protein [Romboutsia lituseburensis]
MELKKQWLDSVNNRVSRRTYLEKDLNDTDILSITNLIDEINKESKLNIQFIKNGKLCISGFKASYGMISGVNSFVALVANKDIKNYKQKIGYYGEMITLQATSLGLGTCWVGGTYDKNLCKKHIKFSDNEDLIGIIAIGYVPKELSIKEKVVKNLNKKNKDLKDLFINNQKELYSWMESGAEFALKAPTALNKKEISFEVNDGKVKAIINSKNHGYEDIDLGICMLHFELGANKEGHLGNWYNENGSYIFY